MMGMDMNMNSANTNGQKKPANPLNFKIVKCKNFDKEGNCRYGNSCTFAHGDTDLRSKSDNNMMSDPNVVGNMMNFLDPNFMAMMMQQNMMGMDYNQMMMSMGMPMTGLTDNANNIDMSQVNMNMMNMNPYMFPNMNTNNNTNNNTGNNN